jgi:hypothetical protein
VPTRPKPDNFKGDSWPASITVGCANDVMYQLHELGPDGKQVPTGIYEEPSDHYGHCRVEEKMGDLRNQWGRPYKADPFTFAFVVLREPVLDAGGQIIGLRDVTETWKDSDGREHTLPAIRLAQQKWSNFWGAVKAASYISATVCNRDYLATKDGTEVTVQALDPTPDHVPGAPTWQPYEDAMALMKLDLGQSVVEKADKDFHARFLDPDYKWPDKKPGKDGDAAGEDESPAAGTAPKDPASDAVNEAAIEALRARLQGSSASAPAEGSPGA